MRCPTCGKEGLIITTKVCPRCDSRLTSDSDLDDNPQLQYRKQHSLLKGKVVELARKKEKLEQKNGRLSGWLLLALLLILSSLILKKNPVILQEPDTSVKDSLELVINKQNQEIQDLKANKQIQSKDSVRYMVREGDNLTKISQLFYNEDSLLFKIAGINEIPVPDEIFAGDTIMIYFIK